MLKQDLKAIPRLPTFVIGLFLLAGSFEVNAKDYLVGSQNKYIEVEKKVKPGDTIILKNGVWNDFEILFRGKGTADQPITLRAQDAGKVIISGQSNLRIAGEHLLVSGLVFKDGYTPTQSVISFRRAKGDYAYHSRMTQLVIDNFNNPERTETDYWVAMYGKHNRFDHNHLEGKRNKGVTMAVRLNSEESQQNHHRIDHNYFGPRPILGSNGGETLRVGTSHFSQSESFTVVENNYFDRCDGELEIISNKSAGNIYRGNVFFESRGTLTMRHGSNTLVEGNVFFGNGVDHTGGIRVINGEQTIRNNYMEGLAGYRFGGALVVMNGVPNSPINRYHQVKNALIENNSLIESDHIQLAAGSDLERSAVPIDSQFRNNLIYHSDSVSGKQGDHQDRHKVFTVYDDISGIAFENNLQHNSGEFAVAHGFTNATIELKRASNGLMYPVDEALGQFGVAKDLNPILYQHTGTACYPKPNGASLIDGGVFVFVSV
jgi:poly(beta-D-mannuronate) lyase